MQRELTAMSPRRGRFLRRIKVEVNSDIYSMSVCLTFAISDLITCKSLLNNSFDILWICNPIEPGAVH